MKILMLQTGLEIFPKLSEKVNANKCEYATRHGYQYLDRTLPIFPKKNWSFLSIWNILQTLADPKLEFDWIFHSLSTTMVMDMTVPLDRISVDNEGKNILERDGVEVLSSTFLSIPDPGSGTVFKNLNDLVIGYERSDEPHLLLSLGGLWIKRTRWTLDFFSRLYGDPRFDQGVFQIMRPGIFAADLALTIYYEADPSIHDKVALIPSENFLARPANEDATFCGLTVVSRHQVWQPGGPWALLLGACNFTEPGALKIIESYSPMIKR